MNPNDSSDAARGAAVRPAAHLKQGTFELEEPGPEVAAAAKAAAAQRALLTWICPVLQLILCKITRILFLAAHVTRVERCFVSTSQTSPPLSGCI